MAIEITTEDSAQDEVASELFYVLSTATDEALKEIKSPDLDKQRADDLIYLISRAGVSYRYHAESQRMGNTLVVYSKSVE